MARLTRRGFLGTATGVGGAAVLGTPAAQAAQPAAAGQAATGPAVPAVVDTVTVTASDPRYLDLTQRGYNARFAARPDAIRLVHSTEQVVAAVQEAVTTGARITVRSGGHCLDGLVDDPEVRILVDLSEMNAVGYDASRRAFSVQGGATLGQVYRTLYLEWGVTIPAGDCPTVGVGGHVTGGGYGPLNRKYGAVVDHLYAVEVVYVDSAGTARSVIATREADDPNRELWWAHTGGGGGQFGIVTRFWFRSPGATGTDPAGLLPKPPHSLLKTSTSWKWTDLTEADFTRIVRNHNAWHAAHNEPGTDYDTLNSALLLYNYVQGAVSLTAQLDGSLPDSRQLLDSYIAAVADGVSAPHTTTAHSTPWLKESLKDHYDTGLYNRGKFKGAYLRKGWSAAQLAVLYRNLSDPAYTGHGGAILFSYGAQVTKVAPDATALAQRDSMLKANFLTYWTDPAEDDRHVAWLRALYRDFYAATGGVPLPDGDADGSYINYPDPDLTDPRWNTSGVPWQTLYWKGNHPRLQAVKKKWDPRDVFHHALSVTACR
ncbi:FAD-binding protein [Streptomyces sp. NPDC006743]|uniref:FAD-binding oxidoreductase n=1 Tax=Streptomyces sp. NPDC006743 TaxID=3154480 RepID=UPI003452C067